jgi:hypothetical protein
MVALVPGKIEIDVGGSVRSGLRNRSKQQAGAERLYVGDAEGVGHDRVRDGAATTVGGFAVVDDVVHDQEVVRESFMPMMASSCSSRSLVIGAMVP